MRRRFIYALAATTAIWAAGVDDVRLRTRLTGGAVGGMTPSGQAEFRARPSNGADRSFSVEVEDVNLPAGTVLEVQINGRSAGRLTISPAPVRGGELELRSSDGDLTPELRAGDLITICSDKGVVMSGAIQTRALDDLRRNPALVQQFATPSSASAVDDSTTRVRSGLTGGAISGLTPSGHIELRQRGSDMQ